MQYHIMWNIKAALGKDFGHELANNLWDGWESETSYYKWHGHLRRDERGDLITAFSSAVVCNWNMAGAKAARFGIEWCYTGIYEIHIGAWLIIDNILNKATNKQKLRRMIEDIIANPKPRWSIC